MMPSLRAALAFLTVVGRSSAPVARATRWFAPVGFVAGLALGGVWWSADQLWPPLVAAVIVVGADAALTGMLHLDGLADCGDGLLGPMDRDRRLRVMRDPAIGAFGLVTLAMVLLLRVVTLAALTPEPLLLAGLWGAARGVMALALTTLPYARAGSGGGLADGFRGSAGTGRLVDGTLIALCLTVAAVSLGWPAGLAAAAGLVVGSGAVLLLARRRLGGFTGDVLGAAGVVGETVALLVAAAQW